MSVENNKSIVRRYYEEVGNTGNVDLMGDFISKECIEIFDGKKHTIGIEGAKAHIVGVRQTFRDLYLTIDLQIAQDDWVVTCVTVRGTHLGTWMGMKPTGKKLAITGVNVDRVVNERIVEHGGAANMLEPLLEVGAIRVVS
jgi:predicted ester cyclase